MRRSLALLPVLGYLRAAAFSGVGTSPVARHRLAPSPVGRRTALTRARLVVDPVAAVDLASHASAALDLPSGLVAFADQGGNLAGKFFMFSLPSYVAFLYFLGYEETKAPRLSYFGFQFLLLFVTATIPTGIISKSTFGLTLADVDWLHGSAEALLTATNVCVALGFRNAMAAGGPAWPLNADEEPGTAPTYDPTLQNVALGVCGAVALACGAGVPLLGAGAHDPFLFGLGNLDPTLFAGLHAEPVNALSIPTWLIHYSSVFEWIFAMGLVWKFADVQKAPVWKGLTWGMLPLHASGICACTYHFFYNDPAVGWLVPLQAFLTLLGNTTVAIAAYRIAADAGWTLGELNPTRWNLKDVNPIKGTPRSFVAAETDADEGPPQLAADPAVAEEAAVLLVLKLVAATTVAAFATKYGELALGELPYSGSSLAAAAIVFTPPALVARAFKGAGDDGAPEV